MSKGSAPRPIPDREGYEANWDRVFGNKERGAKDGDSNSVLEGKGNGGQEAGDA